MIINTSTSSKKEVIPDYQEKTVQAASFPVVLTADTGYDALSKATVQAPENLSAGNIRTGVNIAGVVGTYAPNLQSRVVTPTAFPQIVDPQPGFDGMSKVTVNSPTPPAGQNVQRLGSLTRPPHHPPRAGKPLRQPLATAASAATCGIVLKLEMMT